MKSILMQKYFIVLSSNMAYVAWVYWYFLVHRQWKDGASIQSWLFHLWADKDLKFCPLYYQQLLKTNLLHNQKDKPLKYDCMPFFEQNTNNHIICGPCR